PLFRSGRRCDPARRGGAGVIGREQLELVRDGYLRPTPAGAFRAVSGATPDAVSTFLHAILRQPSMPWLDLGTVVALTGVADPQGALAVRSEEHTSELQSRENLVCRLLLEKKKAT